MVGAILELPDGAHVLAAGTAGWQGGGALSSVTSAAWTTTRASSAMSRSGEASSGLMSISAIQGCSTTSSDEADEELFEGGHVDRRCGRGHP